MIRPQLRFVISLLLAEGFLCLPAYSQQDGNITTSDGIRIHYLSNGEKNGHSPMIFIPGWSFTSQIWQTQLEHFAKNRRVIAIDPRSQGDSTKTDGDNTPEARARDLREIIQQLELKNVVLVGWSQGVQDVAAYVEQFGADSIAGFVLVDSPFSSGPAEFKLHPQFSERLFELMAIYSAHPKEYYAGMIKSITKHEISPEQLHQLTTNSEKMSTTSGLAMLVTDLFMVDRRPVLKKLSKPTLIIASAESKELESQREMQRSIPNAQLEVISEAGHAVFIDQPKKFNHLLDMFLEKLESQPKPNVGRDEWQWPFNDRRSLRT
jgi:non-heme chloroperoxidase